MAKPIPYVLPFNSFLEILRLNEAAIPPRRAYKDSAAYDLSACLIADNGLKSTLTVAPRTTKLIPTGFAMFPPKNHVLLICSRSGMAKSSIFISNAPGVIDPDYTGDISVLLYNGSTSPHFVRHGDRIAQLLIVPFSCPPLLEVFDPPASIRGDKGFGSTGR